MENLELKHDVSSDSPTDSKPIQTTELEDNIYLNNLNIESEILSEDEAETYNNEETASSLDEDIIDNENSPEDSNETPSESVDIEVKDANTTNCLALTIQEDHKLVAVKNVFIRSIRMSWKVVVSAITLAIIRLFT